MITVLEASAALEIAFNREDAVRFKSILFNSDVVIAPDIFPSEITNAIWKYRILASVDQRKCEAAIDYCIDMIDDYIGTKELCREVFSQSVKSKHPVNDMFYLVVARRNGAVLITKDQKLIKSAKEMQIEVIENKS